MVTDDEPVVPDRVIAVTTTTGRDILVEKLFKQGHWEKMIARLQGLGVDLDRKLKFGAIGDCIRVYSNLAKNSELDDIRTQEDNEAVAEFLMETLRAFTENPDVRLVVSIAGGRKTTGALLHSVMTLIGRSQDSIKHILVNEPWTWFPDYLYPGCEGEFKDRETGELLDSNDAVLELAEVPFVPLRYLFQRDMEKCAGSYMGLMQHLRSRSLNFSHELEVDADPNRGTLRINGIEVSLSPLHYLFYLYCLQRASNGFPPISAFIDIRIGDLESLVGAYRVDGDFQHWTYKAALDGVDPAEDIRKWANGVRSALKVANFDQVQIDRLVPKGGRRLWRSGSGLLQSPFPCGAGITTAAGA
jgi:CRISPR-associated protein (TIGR02584 family)